MQPDLARFCGDLLPYPLTPCADEGGVVLGFGLLQELNVPDTLHQRLRRYAHEHKCTLRDVVLIALERELARCEWHERLAQRPTTDLGVSAAALLAQERQQREQDLP